MFVVLLAFIHIIFVAVFHCFSFLCRVVQKISVRPKSDPIRVLRIKKNLSKPISKTCGFDPLGLVGLFVFTLH